MSALLSRAQLRRTLRQTRRALSLKQQQDAANGVFRQLAQHPYFIRAQHIALYCAADGEISPHILAQAAWRYRKQLYLPVLSEWPSTQMNFQVWLPNGAWKKNRFGIAEPHSHPAKLRDITALDLILLPLVGFDEQGARLGMGGGFYDRSLARLNRHPQLRRPRLIGLAHECQKVDQLSVEPWDIPLDATVTAERWYINAAAARAQ